MEKPIIQPQQQPQQQQKSHESLKCPRCASSNTKFCYYNNYSLSQPRHFCKACKRYWTRGGTLRNVPVGGGCRKNKRSVNNKTPVTTTTAATDHVSPTPPNQTNPNPNLDNHHLINNPLFYNGLLPQNPNYPRFDTRVVSRVNETTPVISGYDHLLQPHMNNASGLVFSADHDPNFTFSSYNSSMYGGGGSTTSSASAPSTIASLLASRLINQHEQRFTGFDQTYDGGKDLKMEETQNMMEWNSNNFRDQNRKNDQLEDVVVSSDHPTNSILWDDSSKEGGGGWFDPPANNIGSSTVPSLI